MRILDPLLDDEITRLGIIHFHYRFRVQRFGLDVQSGHCTRSSIESSLNGFKGVTSMAGSAQNLIIKSPIKPCLT